MKTNTVKITDAIEVEVSNTVRDEFARAAFAARMPSFNDTGDIANIAASFVALAAHTKAVRGLDWSPPPITSSGDELIASFEQLLAAIPNAGIIAAWVRAISSSIEPVSDEQEQDGENPTHAVVLESES